MLSSLKDFWSLDGPRDSWVMSKSSVNKLDAQAGPFITDFRVVPHRFSRVHPLIFLGILRPCVALFRKNHPLFVLDLQAQRSVEVHFFGFGLVFGNVRGHVLAENAGGYYNSLNRRSI